MAKSKPNPIVHETNHVIVMDYGIYWDQAFKPEAFRDQAFAQQLKAGMKQKLANHIQRTARDEIESIRFRMQIAAREFVAPDDNETFRDRFERGWVVDIGIQCDLGDGPQDYSFLAPRTAGIRQVASVLNLIDVELGRNPSERECKVFLAGITAGRCLEMIDTALPAEPNTLIGKKAVSGASQAGKLLAKLSPEQQRAAKKERDDMWAYGHPKTDTCRIIGEKYNVSYKTIARLK